MTNRKTIRARKELMQNAMLCLVTIIMALPLVAIIAAGVFFNPLQGF